MQHYCSGVVVGVPDCSIWEAGKVFSAFFTFCCYGNPSILFIRLPFNFSEGKQHKENTVESHRFPWSLLLLLSTSKLQRFAVEEFPAHELSLKVS
jgi:hypothetical protein